MNDGIRIHKLSEFIDKIEEEVEQPVYLWDDRPKLKKTHFDQVLENIASIYENYKNSRTTRAKEIREILEEYHSKFDLIFKVAIDYYYNDVRNYKRFYRGSSNIQYRNAPGIYRNVGAASKEEYYYFNEMQVRCPHSFANMRNINKLTYMQHYGCPTRLLDITSNPLVALYFACKNNNTLDGVVNIFTVPNRDVLYEQSDRVRLLSKLAEFKWEEQVEVLLLSFINIFKGSYVKNSRGQYSDKIIERFYHAVKNENPAFERNLVPIDLLKPIFVQVPKDNPRILKQDGAFIISGLDICETDAANKIDKYLNRRIVIPSHSKKKLLKSLENVGISQATLFPEADQVADYLKKK